MKKEQCCMGPNEMNPEKMMKMMQAFFGSEECGCDMEKAREIMNSFCSAPNKANEKGGKDGMDEAHNAGCG